MFWNFLAGLYCFRDSRYLHVTASGFGAGVRAVFCSFFFRGGGGGWMKELKNYLWLFGKENQIPRGKQYFTKQSLLNNVYVQ